MPAKEYRDRAMWVYFGSSARLEEIRAEAEKRDIGPSKYLVAAEEAFRTIK